MRWASYVLVASSKTRTREKFFSPEKLFSLCFLEKLLSLFVFSKDQKFFSSKKRFYIADEGDRSQKGVRRWFCIAVEFWFWKQMTVV